MYAILYGGQLYAPPGAASHGLVDRLTSGEFLEGARSACRRLAQQRVRASETIKASLKGPAIRQAQASLDRLRRAFLEAWFSPGARRPIGEARARLQT
jgi:hypothetical protein